MWLWYLELYLLAVLMFAFGALVGLAGVRLAVRRTANEPGLVGPAPEPTPEAVEAGP